MCVVDKGHQKKLMLAVEKLKRISAALLRHSTSHYQRMTSSPPGGDFNGWTQGQNGGTLKAPRRNTAPINSAVVPINVCHSATLLPVTSHKSVGRHFDDVITMANERCVTSFGDVAAACRLSGGDERSDTSTSRNYFTAADAYSGTMNVNGVCFSVYGTLPRNLVRGRVQGQAEVQGRKLSDPSSDQVCTPRRRPAPSPPKRTNSIKTDLQRPSDSDLESTLTRGHRKTIPGECQVGVDDVLSRTVTDRMQHESGCTFTTENERFLPFADGCTDTMKHRTATSAAPLANDAAADRRRASGGEISENTAVTDQEFVDSATVKRRHRCRDVDGGELTQSVTLHVDLATSLDAAGVSNGDVVCLDQEFDDGTLKRRQKSRAVVASNPLKRNITEQDDRQVNADSVGNDSDVVLDQEFDSGTVKRRHRSLTDDKSRLAHSAATDIDLRSVAS